MSLDMAGLASWSAGQMPWLQASTMKQSGSLRWSRSWPLPWWASRSTTMILLSPSLVLRQWTTSEMSGNRQKPPPELKLEWWQPPERLTAQPSFMATQAARIDPSVALNCGSSTRHLSRKPGMKKRGISTAMQTGMVQHILSRYQQLIFSASRLRGGLSGSVRSWGRMRPLSARNSTIWRYFWESKGWHFSMPQKVMLQPGLQTKRERGRTEQVVVRPKRAVAALQSASRRRGQRATQTGPTQAVLLWSLDARAQTNWATPPTKHSPSTIQYIPTICLLL